MSGLEDILVVSAITALAALIFWMGIVAGREDAGRELDRETKENLKSRLDTDADIETMSPAERRERLAQWVRKEPK